MSMAEWKHTADVRTSLSWIGVVVTVCLSLSDGGKLASAQATNDFNPANLTACVASCKVSRATCNNSHKEDIGIYIGQTLGAGSSYVAWKTYRHKTRTVVTASSFEKNAKPKSVPRRIGH